MDQKGFMEAKEGPLTKALAFDMVESTVPEKPFICSRFRAESNFFLMASGPKSSVTIFLYWSCCSWISFPNFYCPVLKTFLFWHSGRASNSGTLGFASSISLSSLALVSSIPFNKFVSCSLMAPLVFSSMLFNWLLSYPPTRSFFDLPAALAAVSNPPGDYLSISLIAPLTFCSASFFCTLIYLSSVFDTSLTYLVTAFLEVANSLSITYLDLVNPIYLTISMPYSANI